MPASVRQQIAPLFDVAAPTKDADVASARRYVQKNIDRMKRFAEDFHLVFVDSSELDATLRMPGDMHPLTVACRAILDEGSKAIPVTGLHRDSAHNDAALSIARDSDAPLCLRLDATDVSTSKLSYNNIARYIENTGLSYGGLFLLLDLQGLFGRDAAQEAAQVSKFLSVVKTFPWAGIIVGGYGIPEQLTTAIPPNSQGYLPRVELAIFAKLDRTGVESPLWFADYTVLPPSVVELDWRLIHKVMAPKAIYTLEDSWLVVRGGAFLSHPDGRDQYYSLAKEIVALDEFSGANFSSGDKYIADRAQEIPSPGSAGSWITACVNHHVTFTARSLAR